MNWLVLSEEAEGEDGIHNPFLAQQHSSTVQGAAV